MEAWSQVNVMALTGTSLMWISASPCAWSWSSEAPTHPGFLYPSTHFLFLIHLRFPAEGVPPPFPY